MTSYEILTLVDISNTNANRFDPDFIKVSQQSNFNSLIQTIGLRSNLDWRHSPAIVHGPVSWSNGPEICKYWRWEFSVEADAVFGDASDPVRLLVDDLHGVPIIDKLTETAIFKNPIFSTKGDTKNTLITLR